MRKSGSSLSSTSSTSSETLAPQRHHYGYHHHRPPFLSHVTKEDLQQALQIAKTRHVQAVQKALENYPTNVVNVPVGTGTGTGTGRNNNSSSSTQEQQEQQQEEGIDLTLIQLQQYNLSNTTTNNKLPDFDNELPHCIYVTKLETPIFTAKECQDVITIANEYFYNHHYNNGTWTLLPSGQYQVAGFWIKDIPAIHDWFVRIVQTKLFPLLAQTFPNFVGKNPLDLCVDNAYVFQYTPETGRRTEIHTDSGCLSFTIALNSAKEFTGGGTWFEGLVLTTNETTSGVNETTTTNPNVTTTTTRGAVLEMDQGQVTIRPGGMKHCGQAVNSGVRYIIGGFCMHQKKPEYVRQLLNPPNTRSNVEAALVLNPNFDSSYNVLSRTLRQEEEEQQQQQQQGMMMIRNNNNNNLQQRIAFIQKQRQEILEYCLQHVHPYSGDVAFELGSLYQQQEHEQQKAQETFQICLQADPYDVDALVALLMLAAQQQQGNDDDKKNAKQMERHYAQRILTAPSASNIALAKAYCNLGVLKGEENNEKMKKNIKQTKKYTMSDGGGTNILEDNEEDDDDDDDEISYYQKSIYYDPHRFASRYSLACAYATRKQWILAITEFQHALQVLDDHHSSSTSSFNNKDEYYHYHQQQREQTLKQLYVTCMRQIQMESNKNNNNNPTQDYIMKRFGDLMGQEYLQQLMALQQQQQQPKK